MKITSMFILQVANLIIIRASHAPFKLKDDTSSRMLDSVPLYVLCMEESEYFSILNRVFQEGFKSDESSLSCVMRDDVQGPDYYLRVAFCNYDKVSAKTVDECEMSNGVLYNVHAQETCAQHPGTIIDVDNENTPLFYIDTGYENAYLCVGKSCDVDEVLERYKRDIERDGRCSIVFEPMRSQKHPTNSYKDKILTSFDVTSSTSTPTSSSEDATPSKSTPTPSTTDYHPGVVAFVWVFGLLGISVVILGIWRGVKSVTKSRHPSVGCDNTEYIGRRYESEEDEEEMVAVQIT